MKPGSRRGPVWRVLIAGLLGLLGACLATATQAQDIAMRDAAISVQTRPRPDLDPVPTRLAAFDVLPSAELRTTIDDNVYAARAAPVADALVTLDAGIAARSTWTRHAVSLAANAAVTRGLAQKAEDTQTYDATGAASLDLGIDTRASARIGFARAYEPRGSIGDTTWPDPRPHSRPQPRLAFHTLDLNVELRHGIGRLMVEAQASLDTFRYASRGAESGTLPLRDRDYRTWSATLLAGHAIGPGIVAFVEGRYNQARYPRQAAALDRGSNGYALRGGVQFGMTRLVRGRAAIGYQHQRYADPAFPRIKGLDFAAALEWSPTRLVTWSLEARRTIQRSALVGVAGIRQSRYSARADYELRRNLILSARVERTLSDYAGTPRVQKDMVGTLGAQWLAGRHLRIAAQAGFQSTRSDGIDGRRFDRRRVSVSLRYAL